MPIFQNFQERKMKKIKTPVSTDVIMDLKIGDEVEIQGVIITARDAAHKLMVERKPDFLREILKGGIIYHCGPIVKKQGDEWKILSAGPTTSIREEPYEATVMEEYGVKCIIGKGGMGNRTLEACKRLGAVYLHAVGGAATYLSMFIKKVRDVYYLDELGAPEAFWVLEVDGFPAVVTMDAHGESLHKQVLAESQKKFEDVLGKKFSV